MLTASQLLCIVVRKKSGVEKISDLGKFSVLLQDIVQIGI